jgi:CCR4-NOT transcriptional regulation complex NOT5 subunit
VFGTSPSIDSAVQKMTHFTEETLFYVFYSMPGDAMQAAAAAELCVPMSACGMRMGFSR